MQVTENLSHEKYAFMLDWNIFEIERERVKVFYSVALPSFSERLEALLVVIK